MATKTNNSTTIAKCTQRSAAAQQYVPKKGTITVRSQQYTQQQVEAVYQASLDARQTLVNLRGQVTAALAARKQADATMKNFDEGLEAWVDTTFGPTSQQAIDFGYAKKAPQKPTVATKAEAQQKAVVTREVRGTVGPKKRLKITAATAATPTATPASPGTTTTAPVTPAATPKS